MEKMINKINRYNFLKKTCIILFASGLVLDLLLITCFKDLVTNLIIGILIFSAILCIFGLVFDYLTLASIEKLKSETKEMKIKNRNNLFLSKNEEFFPDEKTLIIINSNHDVSFVKLSAEDIAEMFE